MKSFVHAIIGNAVGTPGIMVGRGLVIGGTTVAKGGEKLSRKSTEFRDGQLKRAEEARKIEATEAAEREKARHEAAMNRIEEDRKKEEERHERTVSPAVVPGDAAAAPA